jgi:predicted acetyltransferase
VTIEILHGTPERHRDQAAAMANALLSGPPDDDTWARIAPSWLETPSFGAWDAGTCVGNVAEFLVDTTVPGGARLPTGAVTRVGIVPTHRRRGIATQLVRRLVDDARERGLALLSLRASEATIYERYGFGMAGEFTDVTIDPARARPVAGGAADGGVRFVPRDDVLSTIVPVYEQAMRRRVGTISRTDALWRRYVADAIKLGPASHVVVHENAEGDVDGYAHYDVRWNDEAPTMSGGSGVVHEVIALDDAAELALWAYLLDIDLIRSWRATERPVDDLVRHALADRRAYAVTAVEDEQWLRLVDVDRALRARTYAPVGGAVTLAVDDPWIADNCGVWRITSDGAERTDEAADLRAGIAALSAAYLGGTPWRALAATGRVAGDLDALALADALMGVRPLPHCGSFF